MYIIYMYVGVRRQHSGKREQCESISVFIMCIYTPIGAFLLDISINGAFVYVLCTRLVL